MQRNRAKVCTYYIRGKCNRGAECPFRHEMPEGGELAHQNIRDRYYGNNDPVARKMLRRLGERPRLDPPEDTAITTLYVGNVERNWTEDDLRSVFSKHGELTRIKLVPNKSCAFVTYAQRDVRTNPTVTTSCLPLPLAAAIRYPSMSPCPLQLALPALYLSVHTSATAVLIAVSVSGSPCSCTAWGVASTPRCMSLHQSPCSNLQGASD